MDRGQQNSRNLENVKNKQGLGRRFRGFIVDRHQHEIKSIVDFSQGCKRGFHRRSHGFKRLIAVGAEQLELLVKRNAEL